MKARGNASRVVSIVSRNSCTSGVAFNPTPYTAPISTLLYPLDSIYDGAFYSRALTFDVCTKYLSIKNIQKQNFIYLFFSILLRLQGRYLRLYCYNRQTY